MMAEKQERPGTWARAKKRVVRRVGNLLNRWADLVKLGRRLFVFGKHDVDLRVGRNGDYHTAVGIEAHHLRVSGRADILGKPLTKHVVLRKRRAGVVPGNFCKY
jgi:hypothetical protein